MRIGTIGNYYGHLEVKKDGEKYFWGIEDHDSMEWEEIPESLYLELVKYRSPPKSRNKNKEKSNWQGNKRG